MTNDTTRPQPDTPLKDIIIRCSDLNFFYGNVQALFNITLDIYAKSVTALIGPSGCGKSTFIRCLNRMNDFIDSSNLHGKIIMNGQDIYAPEVDAVALRKKVGMIFQKSNPFPKSIYENVAYGPKLSGIRKRSVLDQIVQQSLERAALWEEVKDTMSKSAVDLSGGQQQRLCIARALAIDPEILLMDEPASALDPISTSKIEELIMELKKDFTIIIVTHNMQQALRVSMYTAFFFTGKIVEYDTTSKIFNAPASKKTQDYINGQFG